MIIGKRILIVMIVLYIITCQHTIPLLVHLNNFFIFYFLVVLRKLCSILCARTIGLRYLEQKIIKMAEELD